MTMEAARDRAERMLRMYRLRETPLDASEISDICERATALIVESPIELERHDVERVRLSVQPNGFVLCGVARAGELEYSIYFSLEDGVGIITRPPDNGVPWSRSF